jgi:hypothetical protein
MEEGETERGGVMKYLHLEGKFIIETSHGCYSNDGWCYTTFRLTEQEATQFVTSLKTPDDYRVVDWQGKVVYPLESGLMGEKPR